MTDHLANRLEQFSPIVFFRIARLHSFAWQLERLEGLEREIHYRWEQTGWLSEECISKLNTAKQYRNMHPILTVVQVANVIWVSKMPI